MRHLIVFFVIFIFLSGCGPETRSTIKTSKIVNQDKGGIFACSNITGNKKNRFIKFVNSRQFDEAEKLYFKNENWFKKCSHKLENSPNKLAEGINNKYRYKFENLSNYFQKTIVSSNDWLTDWTEFDNKSKDARVLIAKYRNERFINTNNKYKINIVSNLENNISTLKNEFELNIDDFFSRYNLFDSSKSFFDIYPYKASENERKSLVNSNFNRIIKKFNENLLKKNNLYIENYFNYLNNENKNYLKRDYIKKFYEENNIDENNLSFNEYLSINTKIENSTPKYINLPKINKKTALFEVNNLEFEDSSFDYNLVNNSNYINKFLKIKIDELQKHLNNYDYVFIVSFNSLKFENILESKNVHESKYVYSTQQVNNPEYSKLINRVNFAMNEERSAYRSQQYECNKTCAYGYEWICIASCSTWTAALLKWQNEKYNAEAKLQNTPAFITKNLYQPYQYYSTKVKAIKKTDYNLFVIDNIKNKIHFKNFKSKENKIFKLVYNINDKDEDRTTIINRYQKENDIEKWKKINYVIKSKSIIDNFLKNFNSFKSLESENELIANLKPLKKKILTNSEVNEAEEDYLKSVGKIIRGDGGVGTGFFVSKNILITNQHVIEGASIITIELSDGSKGSGNLIAQDISKDLAAIKSSISGTPVIISDEKLSLGKDVLAIGHPEGFGFSLTKGIISAVRKLPSINDYGLSEVQYIQTDAAINHGNSGGPLLLNGKLVGVNTQGIRKDIAEGLNFALHRSELLYFLKNNLSEYLKVE